VLLKPAALCNERRTKPAAIWSVITARRLQVVEQLRCLSFGHTEQLGHERGEDRVVGGGQDDGHEDVPLNFA
jgi:hypothetical protein